MKLPADIRVFERGWLSSNNILLLDPAGAALIDSGYGTHADQTVALVAQALAGQPLARLVNTHLHSDHCGGNAALQARFPDLQTWIPPGLATAVQHWDVQALSYAPTGQSCPRFRVDRLLLPGRDIRLGQRHWQVHAAPGHDPHSVLLFEPDLRLLVTADALWENGFGVVFPEIEGQQAFDEVGRTLDLIDSLQAGLVIPGHGAPFTNIDAALDAARRRLAYFRSTPDRHARYAAKVLLKFKLLEQQRIAVSELQRWARQTPYLELLRRSYFASQTFASWIDGLTQDLVESNAAGIEHAADTTLIVNR